MSHVRQKSDCEIDSHIHQVVWVIVYDTWLSGQTFHVQPTERPISFSFGCYANCQSLVDYFSKFFFFCMDVHYFVETLSRLPQLLLWKTR